MKNNGVHIAQTIRASLSEAFASLPRPVALTVLSLSNDSVTEQYTRIKEKMGKDLGVSVSLPQIPHGITTDDFIARIHEEANQSDGIIVQLPLPSHIDAEKVRDAIPKEKDVDCLGTDAYRAFEEGESAILPPVVGAFEYILRTANISVAGKKVVVVGHGRLVGAPAAAWFKQSGADVIVCDEHTEDVKEHTQKADIVVLGAGVPGLLKPDMIKEGVVILDAGTSESGGIVVGDADPACADKASLMTPVPGGIGPITIAMLYKNLYTLVSDKMKS